MTLRFIGASMIIAGSAICGVISSNYQKNKIVTLEELICILDMFICELGYNRTPLPELCRKIGNDSPGMLSAFLVKVAEEMDTQIKPSVTACVQAALQYSTELSKETKQLLKQLGDTLGKFDVDGEILGLQALRVSAVQKLEAVRLVRKERGKTNQTLWICAGVAAAVLMM